MNRQIKFRGKRCRDGQWVYGFYCEATDTWNGLHPHKSWILGRARSNGGWFAMQGATAVIDDTVGQFTGCLDKNGTEIYEGDIVRVDISRFDSRIKNHRYTKSKVEWCQDEFLLCGVDIPVHFRSRIEVIGNIYDNPELLKGGE